MMVREGKKKRQKHCRTTDEKGRKPKGEGGEKREREKGKKSESAIIMKINEIGEVKMIRDGVTLGLGLRCGIRIDGAGAF